MSVGEDFALSDAAAFDLFRELRWGKGGEVAAYREDTRCLSNGQIFRDILTKYRPGATDPRDIGQDISLPQKEIP